MSQTNPKRGFSQGPNYVIQIDPNCVFFWLPQLGLIAIFNGTLYYVPPERKNTGIIDLTHMLPWTQIRRNPGAHHFSLTIKTTVAVIDFSNVSRTCRSIIQ